MSNTRSKDNLPYEVEQKQEMGHILAIPHEIPYHSRPFMWTDTEYTTPTTNKLVSDWKNDKPHWLGVGIFYTGGKIPSVSDMQHRLTLSFLMILILSEILGDEEPLSWISKYGNGKRFGSKPTAEEEEILEKYDWERLPNILSVFDFDFEALGNLLNKKEITNKSESKIYNAYDIIKKILINELADDETKERCEDLLVYVRDCVFITKISISHWEFAMDVFNCFNNIKVNVPYSYLVRNALALAVGKSKSEEIHDLFMNIQRINPKEYEQNVHTIMNLFTKRIIPEKEYSQVIEKQIMEFNGDRLATIHQIFDTYKEILQYLHENRFGKILSTLTGGHEVMTLCSIPILYKLFTKNKKEKLEDFLKLLVCYAIRKGKIQFNALKYQTPLLKLMNELLTDKSTLEACLQQLNSLLIGWLENTNERNNNEFIHRISSESFKGRNFTYKARPMMLFLTEMTDSYETTLNHEATDIDHIYPKKPQTPVGKLRDMENRHKIGNFTPFMSKNKDEMKGNKSLGNKAFKSKIDSYKISNIAMTRQLVQRYETTDFKDEQIMERSLELSQKFAEITARILGIE